MPKRYRAGHKTLPVRDRTDTGPMDGTDEAKRALRSTLRGSRAARRDAPGAALARERDGESLAAAGVDLARDRGVRVVALFEALPTEPPTAALSAALRDSGIEVLLPRMLPDHDLTWHRAGDDGRPGEGLGLQALGRAGLVVVPALAVDPAGGRLGQGGGSYDRALPRARPDALIVAVVHDDEVVDRVPLAEHDRRVDGRLTPAEGWTPAVAGASTGDNDRAHRPDRSV